VRRSARLLERYILQEEYAGYDPYDVLQSPLFKLPLLRTRHTIRLAAQQVMRRVPLNLRPLLRIPKGHNPVTYGLCLQAFSYLMTVYPERKEFYRQQAAGCIAQLKRLRSPGYSGACWGYDFDWESRYTRLDAMTPTVVATGIITNGLFEYYCACADEEALDLCRSATRFVSNDLKRTHDGGEFCFSYSPLDTQVVLNATMKGARLLAQVFSVDRDPNLLKDASSTVRFVLRHQQRDGGWSYSLGDKRDWIDNFHTGYVLECLHEYRKRTGDGSIDSHLAMGFDFYTSSFFDAAGRPKYYVDSVYPIDSTAAAQSIITLCRFNKVERAIHVANWTISNMQASDGHFFYQRRRIMVNKISYMRWSNAWMLAALSYLLRKHALV